MMSTEMSPYEQQQRREITRRGRAKVIAQIFWAIAFLSAAFGGFVGVTGVIAANGAPQEAAAAAMGCLLAIVPYVLARSADELTR